MAEFGRFLALGIYDVAGGSAEPAVMMSGLLVAAGVIVVAILYARLSLVALPVSAPGFGADTELPTRVRQSNPDAAGHSRSRAPAPVG